VFRWPKSSGETRPHQGLSDHGQRCCYFKETGQPVARCHIEELALVRVRGCGMLQGRVRRSAADGQGPATLTLLSAAGCNKGKTAQHKLTNSFWPPALQTNSTPPRPARAS